jgi:hypothetical protein
MKTLKLDLEGLKVESFEAEAARAERTGTVRANQTGVDTCYPCTDWDTCGGTCWWTPCA